MLTVIALRDKKENKKGLKKYKMTRHMTRIKEKTFNSFNDCRGYMND